MIPLNRNAVSALKEPSSNLEVLTASLAALGKERRSESLNDPCSVLQTVQSSSDSLRSAVLLSSATSSARDADAAKTLKLILRAVVWTLATVAALLPMVALALTMLPLQNAAENLAALRRQVEDTQATLVTEQQKLQETQASLRALAKWAPISRFQLVQSGDSATPFIRIVPGSIQNREGVTIATPELSTQK